MERWCNGCRVRIASDLKLDRQRRDLHKSNLPATSRKIGPVLITASVGGFALAAAQIDQFMKLDEMSETSISHGGHSSVGSSPCPGAIVRVVADHDDVVPGCPDEGATVIDVVLDVADDGTLRDPMEQ